MRRAAWMGLMLVWLVLGCLSVRAQHDETLAEGRIAYEQRDFTRAAALWEQVVAAGGTDKALFYNLARAYEYLGEWGTARLYDRRAERVFGADADLAAALARGWARQALETLHPLIGLKRTLNDLTRPVGWGVLGAILWAGVWLGGAFVRRIRGLRAGLIAALLLWGTCSGLSLMVDAALIEAVLMETQPIRSGPGTDYVTLDTWSAGYDVYILEQRGTWGRVTRADGATGWLDMRFMAEVLPEGL